MQERHLYEYAVIRFVPKVEREEFINVGIVLFSKRCKYLKSLYTIDENKLKLFFFRIGHQLSDRRSESLRQDLSGQ